MSEQTKWWYSTDDERYSPADSREDAVAYLEGYHGWIAQGYQPEINVADYFWASDWLEGVEEQHLSELSDPDGDGLFARLTPAETTALQNAVRKAITHVRKAVK